MINVIKSPTRQNALLDPFLIPVDMEVSESVTIALPQGITDHSATYVSIPLFYEIQASYKRTIWLYSRANYELLNKKNEIIIGKFCTIVL